MMTRLWERLIAAVSPQRKREQRRGLDLAMERNRAMRAEAEQVIADLNDDPVVRQRLRELVERRRRAA